MSKWRIVSSNSTRQADLDEDRRLSKELEKSIAYDKEFERTRLMYEAIEKNKQSYEKL